MAETKITRIYALRDPRNGQVRYVGKTHRSLASRLADHVLKAGKPQYQTRHSVRWIAGLVRLGLRPTIELLEEIGGGWAEREVFWIAWFRNNGADLTNHSSGGESGRSGVRLTPELVEAARQRMTVLSRDPEHQRKARNGLTPEVLWLRAAAVARVFENPEAQAKRVTALREALKRPEYREKNKKQLSAMRTAPGIRDKMSASVRAAYCDPEVRARHRAATLAVTGDLEFQRRAAEASARVIRNPEVQRRRIQTLQALPNYQEIVRRRGDAIKAAWARRKQGFGT
jgi:hypothetical protein